MKPSYEELEEKIEKLEAELKHAKSSVFNHSQGKAVSVPAEFDPIFKEAQKTVASYFSDIKADPTRGTIEIADERYVLVRAASLSLGIFKTIRDIYKDRGDCESAEVGQSLLFDIAHIFGINDAKKFHEKMNLKDPIQKLSAGPIHFAYTGWAFVDILPESRPSPDENYFLTYHHPQSFEADEWLQAGEKTNIPVCIMNAGYSSGWCTESFGVKLTAIETHCRAKGDDNCTFIMAPPHKIKQYLPKRSRAITSVNIPIFLGRKKKEEQLQESEQRFRTIFEGAAEGIIIADANTMKIYHANQAACEMFGYSEEEFQQLSVKDIQKPDDQAYAFKGLSAQVDGTKKLVSDILCVKKDGATMYTDIQSSLLPIDGKLCNVGFFTDITERKKLDARLIDAQKMEAIGVLTAGIAHDFNNILSSILGYTSLILMQADDLQMRKDLKDIQNSTEKLADLVKQLLHYAIHVTPDIAAVNLNDVVKQTYSILRHNANEKLVDVVINVDNNLHSIDADVSHVSQITLNLCVNALEAMPKGGELLISTENVVLDNVFISNYDNKLPGDYALLKVKDTGCGIDDEIINKIFEQYFSTKEMTGSGLGLASVNGIMNNYNGIVEVQSQEGKGSTFLVYFPAGKLTLEQVQQQEYVTGQKTILVVDDDPGIQKLTKRLLEELGYKTIVSGNGPAALKTFQQDSKSIDAVILDMVMPGMDGNEVFTQMKQIDPNVQALIITGYYGDEETMQQMLGLGAKDILSKPYNVKSLSEKLKKILM